MAHIPQQSRRHAYQGQRYSSTAQSALFACPAPSLFSPQYIVINASPPSITSVLALLRMVSSLVAYTSIIYTIA